MQATEEQRYQGWANYPTWAVNLWLSNEELALEAQDLVVRAVEQAPSDENVSGGIWTVKETERYRLADALSEWISELADLDEASFRADLLGWALECVDWHEIADAWLEGA